MRIRRRHALERGEFPKSMQEKTAMYGKGEGTGRFRLRWRRPSHGVTARGPIQVELIGGRSVSSGRGWIMYCDGCGTQLTSGGQFCTKCGKPIVPSAVASSPGLGHAGAPAAATTVSNGRVRRNIHRLAILWMISGILRLMGIGWMMIFGKMFFPFMRGWGGPVVWPIGGRWGLDVPFMGGLFSVGIFLGLFGVLHLVLAWGLFEREPWARFLSLALGFLALLRFPFGTALGIYTLWVLLPETSGKEYEWLAQPGGQVNSAPVSS